MSLTITIPGAVEATIGATAPAVLTIGVGTPGATGPAGAAGPGVPAGGTAGQFLTKTTTGVDFATGWTTLPDYLLSSTAASTYQTLSGMSAYLTVSSAATTYAPLASPALTGNPTAPTPTIGDNDTSIATTAFVQSSIIAGSAHAETLQATVRNNTGSTLAPFTVVYINGALGNKATVAKSQANAESTSAGTYAITEASIANNADGNVIVAGVLSGIDTSAFADGDKLYLSPTVAGGVTTTKPSAPSHLVYIGVITRSHPTLGTVSVRIQNGYELGEIHDVALSSEANNDLLVYETSTTLWKNKSFSTLGLLTSSSASSVYAPIANPTFTGTVTIPSGASISGYVTTSSLASYAPLASPALTGTPTVPTALTADSSTTIASTAFVKAQGYLTSAPVTSVAGRTGVVTLAVADVSGAAPLANPTFTGTVTIPSGASISGYASFSGSPVFSSKVTFANPSTVSGGSMINLGLVAGNPFSNSQGDLWYNSSVNKVSYKDGTTVQLVASESYVSTTYAPKASPTFTGTVTIPSGASISGFATLASPTFTGTPLSVTAAVDTNTTQIATTAYVVGQGYAKLASPTFTGTPLSVTAAADTNTTQIATTAYVVSQASTSTPLSNGTATIGTSLKYARADHIHPSDTSLAPLASPTFTGVPAGPTAAVSTNTTQLATTAFVLANSTGGADIQTFTTAGTATWTKPSNKTVAWVRIWSGGAGGGSGARQATTSGRGGGAGGAGGGYLETFIPLSLLGATVTVTIGAGGTAGTAISTDSTVGSSGGLGNTSSFSIYSARIQNTSGGAGGSIASATAGTNSGSNSIAGSAFSTLANAGGGGTTGAGTVGVATASPFMQASGGGGGAGALATVTTAATGGAGGARGGGSTSGITTAIAGGAGGIGSSLTAATAGTSGTANYGGGTGGGGGYYATGVAGGTGGAGAQPGGGGGGGGASDNGFASGAGGAGGAGMVIVICY